MSNWEAVLDGAWEHLDLGGHTAAAGQADHLPNCGIHHSAAKTPRSRHSADEPRPNGRV